MRKVRLLVANIRFVILSLAFSDSVAARMGLLWEAKSSTKTVVPHTGGMQSVVGGRGGGERTEREEWEGRAAVLKTRTHQRGCGGKYFCYRKAVRINFPKIMNITAVL